jgi:hypothetical protein
VISGNPSALQLRYMQTLTEIGATQNSTVIFPLPLDVLKPFLDGAAEAAPSEPRLATEGDAGRAALDRPAAHRPELDPDGHLRRAAAESSARELDAERNPA